MRVLVFIASIAATSAHAAAVRAPIVACKDQADIKRAFRPTSDKDKKENAAYFQGKLGSGECLQLVRDQKVQVDQRDGALWRLRAA